MITKIEELLNEVFYDWGFTTSPQIHSRMEGDGFESFNVNKTTVFHQDGKFWLNYKTETTEVASEVYHQFKLLAQKVKANPSYEEVLTNFHNDWMDNVLSKNNSYKSLLQELKEQTK